MAQLRAVSLNGFIPNLPLTNVAQTRSGKVFSPWNDVATVPAHEQFDFEAALAASLERQLSMGEGTDDDEEDLFSLSPLSSPGTSPDRSPTRPPAEALPAAYNETSEPPTPLYDETSPPMPPLSAAASNKRKGHARRRKKRAAEKAELTPDDYEPRPSTRRKHVLGQDGLQTSIQSEAARIAKTGYVGIRGEKSSAVYGLKQLVGPDSRFGFDLIEWDGQ